MGRVVVVCSLWFSLKFCATQCMELEMSYTHIAYKLASITIKVSNIVYGCLNCCSVCVVVLTFNQNA